MRMDQLPTPCYVIDEKKLKENLEILGDVREKAGCKIPAGPESLFPVFMNIL